MFNKSKNKPLGETPGGAPSQDQIDFLNGVAFPRLDAVKSSDIDMLRHFNDAWWNLCLWEKQRADVLDGKAQSLVGLASIASALVGLSTVLPGTTQNLIRTLAACMFLVTVILAIWALFVSEYGGFYDREVFEALAANTIPVGIAPAFTDQSSEFASYLKEMAMQRWLIYSQYKKASRKKAFRVTVAQLSAGVAVALVFAFIALPFVTESAPYQHLKDAVVSLCARS
ncbi:hypothetical protein [Burkholderia cenocepacia]|nr:hypothetical protein [Burkholderia cenocepacia]HEM7884022.1 hypothetical protein [Burkholderia cenocepacia]